MNPVSSAPIPPSPFAADANRTAPPSLRRYRDSDEIESSSSISSQRSSTADALSPSDVAWRPTQHRKALLTTAVVGAAVAAPLCGVGVAALCTVGYYGVLCGVVIGLEQVAANHLGRPSEHPIATMAERIFSTVARGNTQGDAALERMYQPWQKAEAAFSDFTGAQQSRATDLWRAQKNKTWYKVAVPAFAAARDGVQQAWATSKQWWHGATQSRR